MDLPSKIEEPKPVSVTDPFTLPALIAWLRTKDAKETYCYFNTGHCLISQYLKHLGYADASVGGTFWGRTAGEDIPLPAGWNAVAVRSPHTFGAALKRAEALLS